jgi:hypothetical protein
MLALDDAALARLCIAATAIAPQERGRWLKRVALKLEPKARTPAATRQARVRQRRKVGQHVYRLELRDLAVEGLIEMMLATGRLTERDALDHARVELELARLLEEQGATWAR